MFDQELSRKKSGGSAAAAAGPAATWVAVQHPAKRQRQSFAASASAAVAGVKEEGEDGEGPASPTKGGRRELLHHNAAIKADAQAKQGARYAFLDEQLQVGGCWARLHRAAQGCSESMAPGTLGGSAQAQPLPHLPPAVPSSPPFPPQALRPFIAPEVAATIHRKAAAARAAGLQPPEPAVEVQPGGCWPLRRRWPPPGRFALLPHSVRPLAPMHSTAGCLTATLREYQLEGLRWMVQMWDRGVNAILAGAACWKG